MKHRIFILLLFLTTLALMVDAQKAATVKSFTQTTDHISGNDRRNDFNGEPCALVKVQVVDNIERVEGNKIGEIVNRGVEKWVYMCKGSRNMRIHLANHLPVKVMFMDYDIYGLESNRVYELVIEIPGTAPTVSNSSKMQKLTINYSPSNAMVLVDSKSHKGNGKVELQLPVGDHSYLIAAEGYITAEGIVKLTDRAPRTVIEHLVADNIVSSGKNDETNIAMSDILLSREPQNVVEVQQPVDTPQSIYAKEDRPQVLDEPEEDPVQLMTPPSPLNQSFKFDYEGVSFKCKAKKGYVTITGFDQNAEDVIIPGQVEYEGHYYPVTEINTFINGNNYGARRVVIQEGVLFIANFAFVEFRRLVDVTIPRSISEIGKNAFRNNKDMKFNLPSRVSENDLRKGKSIKRGK